MTKRARTTTTPEIATLRASIDTFRGRFKALRGAKAFDAYLASPSDRADEETLTEPLLAAILERVLGFPIDAYFPQLGRGGLKPDFTPIDQIAHPFVLDAKASDQNLAHHEPQIRSYIDQRALDYGLLFNLREMRVYRRGQRGHDPSLSFQLLPLWQVARGEAIPAGEVDRFAEFCRIFAFRELDTAQRIAHIRSQRSWEERLARGEDVRVDIDFLTERLRQLSRVMIEDAAAQQDGLLQHLSLNVDRHDQLVRELQVLTLDIAPGTKIDALPSAVSEWLATSDGLVHRVWRQYLLRVAYLALTRILLFRAWEDVGFVDDYLYDGGFNVAYDRLRQNTQAVLEEAFAHGGQRYRWLFGADNNYDWYRPREEALVDVLYTLGQFPLGRLDADVLGGLYQSYVDEIDRDRLGQFFTPRAVVRFMLDRAGFSGPEGVFNLVGDRREPKRVYDFATGSGGFLVEAARRIVDEGGVKADDAAGLREALSAVVTGLVGSEISPFPYYLTEINLLLQVSRVLGRLNVLGERSPNFTLGVLHMDSLAARTPFDESLEGLSGDHRTDQAELQHDERFGLVPLDGEKRATYRGLREGGFDLVIGNPPYVAEANNKPLFDRLRNLNAWKGTYRGKTDYLYYFLLLAAEKLKPGGRLCVITPAGWMNAGKADFLRERLAKDLRLDELFLFGSYRLFAPDTPERRKRVPTPTVESAILIATKTAAGPRHRLRVVALEDEALAAAALSDPGASTPERNALLTAMGRRAKGKTGRGSGLAVVDVRQAQLDPTRPWAVKHLPDDLAARVSQNLQDQIDNPLNPTDRLDGTWVVSRGIESGADGYSERIRKRLSNEERTHLDANGAQVGDPILELPPGVEDELPWRDNRGVLVRSPEPTGVLYGACDPDDYASLVVIRGDRAPQAVEKHLERWRPLLETRAEVVRNAERRRWWEALWPRDQQMMTSPKVISLYRTDRGRFALDEKGELQPSNKATLVVGRAKGAPVAYLCGLLNSELLDLWYAVRGKNPRDIWRNYEPLSMNAMPYRRPDGDPRADAIAKLVREIGANRLSLLPHRALFPKLRRTVKNPWHAQRPDVDLAVAIAALPGSETISVRLDPRLRAEFGEAPLGKPHRAAPDRLVFQRARHETGHIAGPGEILDLVEQLAPNADDPRSILLPKDLERLSALVRDRRTAVGALLDEGRKKVEEVERLVCALYGLDDAMTNEVVAHALARVGTVSAKADE